MKTVSSTGLLEEAEKKVVSRLDFSVSVPEWAKKAVGIKDHGFPGSTPFQPRTELGKRLWEIRQQIVASGEPLLSLKEIQDEIARHRGEIA